MDINIKGISMIVVLLAVMVVVSHSYVIPSPMDPVEQCIFTCDHCFQSSKLLQCANECLATDGALNSGWHRACPELLLPLYVDVDLNRQPKVTQT